MPLLLVLEDNPVDLRKAVDIGKRAGFNEVEVYGYASEAKAYLGKALSGDVPVPAGMIVDLDLGIESGFELMRFWHSTPRLKAIPLIVWTVMGEHQREICRLFGATHFISKDDDINILKDALAKISGITGSQSRTA